MLTLLKFNGNGSISELDLEGIIVSFITIHCLTQLHDKQFFFIENRTLLKKIHFKFH